MAVPSVKADNTFAPKTELAVSDLMIEFSWVFNVRNLEAEAESESGFDWSVAGFCERMLYSTTTDPLYTATILI